jgi:hypothetical protein
LGTHFTWRLVASEKFSGDMAKKKKAMKSTEKPPVVKKKAKTGAEAVVGTKEKHEKVMKKIKGERGSEPAAAATSSKSPPPKPS